MARIINVGKINPEPVIVNIGDKKIVLAKIPTSIILDAFDSLKGFTGGSMPDRETFDKMSRIISRLIIKHDSECTPEWVIDNLELSEFALFFEELFKSTSAMESESKKKDFASSQIPETQATLIS